MQGAMFAVYFGVHCLNSILYALGQRSLKAEIKEEKCQHIHGQAFVGGVLREMNTETHFKCCYQCHTKCDPSKYTNVALSIAPLMSTAAKTLCVGWEFHKKTGKCILYRDIFFMKFESEVISGINDCFSST